ncbi:hypothetical protein DACRYDRAFT_112741 [Dacryopinax primogenitus]|uniref:Uncharacterized protein n=1 Tax=Dacryopinax primogenitus (strain DJM 731) TaxID=1858805 RepID=M5FT77_DACPD|nr:uncharacterized protein DACRYDRAFT_112741 [Dacryopinax primogenitus]EJT96461.1 hypothetical protein DACRYDRAFT_112741 [Dacryopinax primogenitus]
MAHRLSGIDAPTVGAHDACRFPPSALLRIHRALSSMCTSSAVYSCRPSQAFASSSSTSVADHSACSPLTNAAAHRTNGLRRSALSSTTFPRGLSHTPNLSLAFTTRLSASIPYLRRIRSISHILYPS